mmetsp:Transcript_23136/g.48191  ORF Transcript_23136/g.48191 Transcript_23136/m.48191 type:complete len:95 (-) Transcript_23136:825-1109(-)
MSAIPKKLNPQHDFDATMPSPWDMMQREITSLPTRYSTKPRQHTCLPVMCCVVTLHQPELPKENVIDFEYAAMNLGSYSVLWSGYDGLHDTVST